MATKSIKPLIKSVVEQPGPAPVAPAPGKDFYSQLLKRINEPAFADQLASAMFNQAMSGDPAALKIVQQVINESRINQGETLTLTDEQIKHIILLTARRIERTTEQGAVAAQS